MKTALMLHYGDNGIRGSEVCFIESVRALQAAGYRTVVVRNQPAMDEFVRPHVSAIEQLQYPELMIDGTATTLPVVRYLRALHQLRGLITRWRPDVIYANGGLPCQLAVPTGRLLKVPVLCHFHHPAIKRAYYLWLVKYADKVIFPSQYTREHSGLKAGVTGDVVHNGVDTDLFRPLPADHARDLRTQLGLRVDALVIGQVGALVPHKRPQLLLKAFSQIAAQLPDLNLCLVGKGPLEAELHQQVLALGLSGRAVITGFVDAVLPYYQQVLDINVLASVEEGLGISIIEGSAVGLPAIIANGTGLRETVTPEKTGLLFQPDDLAGLTAAIVRLASDAELRRRLGAAGREKVCREFALETYRDGVVRAVDETVKLRSARA